MRNKISRFFYSGTPENHDLAVGRGLGLLKMWFDLDENSEIWKNQILVVGGCGDRGVASNLGSEFVSKLHDCVSLNPKLFKRA